MGKKTMKGMLGIAGVDTRDFGDEDAKRGRQKSRVYFHIVGENILEDLLGRFNRPREEYRRLLPEALRRVIPGLDNLNWKAAWSQRAGCSSGCSPGFVLEGVGPFRKDIYVSVGPKPEAVAKELESYAVPGPSPAPAGEEATRAV